MDIGGGGGVCGDGGIRGFDLKQKSADWEKRKENIIAIEKKKLILNDHEQK